MNKIDYKIQVYDCSQLNDDELMSCFDAFSQDLTETLIMKGELLSNMGEIAVLAMQLHLILNEMALRQPDVLPLAKAYMNLDDILINLNIKNNG